MVRKQQMVTRGKVSLQKTKTCVQYDGMLTHGFAWHEFISTALVMSKTLNYKRSGVQKGTENLLFVSNKQ